MAPPPGRLAAAALALLLPITALTGCQSGEPDLSSPPPPAATSAATSAETALVAPSADDAVNQVLAISVDGLNPRAITELGSRGAPAFHRMMREGAWTFNARTAQGMTITLPNHTGMLTGRRIDEKNGGHGVDVNVDNGKTVHQAAGHYVGSVFDVVHDNGGSTALYSAKTKFAFYQRTWNAKGRKDTVGRDNGRAKIDKVALNTDNAALVKGLTTELTSKPRTFTFLHISLPDVAGHAHGFMSKDYVAAVKRTDQLLGTILSTISSRPALRQHLLVVLTADHGGNGASHSDASKPQNYTIPFMAWGPGVAAGKNLYAMNPTFRSPGTSRPGYSGKQPVRNADLANLVTDVLDLPAVPGAEFDRPRTLNLFGS